MPGPFDVACRIDRRVEVVLHEYAAMPAVPRTIECAPVNFCFRNRGILRRDAVLRQIDTIFVSKGRVGALPSYDATTSAPQLKERVGGVHGTEAIEKVSLAS